MDIFEEAADVGYSDEFLAKWIHLSTENLDEKTKNKMLREYREHIISCRGKAVWDRIDAHMNKEASNTSRTLSYAGEQLSTKPDVRDEAVAHSGVRTRRGVEK